MARPKIVLSRCFIEPVRYNGGVVSDEFVEKLKKHVDFVDFCPEFDIGLGVPRQRLIILIKDSRKILYQPDTGKDLTDQMVQYVSKVTESLRDIDGFVLKSKSPSCGVASAKLFSESAVIGKTDGFFAEAVKTRFPYLPVEDEGRLRDKGIREHFLTRIFVFSDLRTLLSAPSQRALVDFHSRHKYLLMAYNQRMLKELGQLVANADIPIGEKISRYSERFYLALCRKPSRKQNLNALTHMIGHISKRLSKAERGHINELLDKYRNGLIEVNVLTELLRNFAFRFENEYLLFQKFLEPYPAELNV